MVTPLIKNFSLYGLNNLNITYYDINDSLSHVTSSFNNNGDGPVWKFPDMIGWVRIPQLLMSLTGMVGVVSNTFVLVVIFFFTTMYKKPAFVFLINQAVIDLLAATLVTCQNLTILSGDPLKNPITDTIPVYSDLLCRLWYSRVLMYSALVSSSYNAVAFALERYIMILHPVFHRDKYTNKGSLILFALAFISTAQI